MSFVEPHFSTPYSSYKTLNWIFVSHYPDDVIMISPSSPPDLDLGDVFTQPPAEEILQLIYNIKNMYQENQIITCHLMKMQIVQEDFKITPE